MIRQQRPPVPDWFLELTGPALERLQTHDQQRYSKKSQRRWPIDIELVRSERVVETLAAAFFHKCAYCETHEANPLIDWFRPTEEALNVDGTVDRDHYWWLAYSWDNLLPACGPCLSSKGRRFPVEGRRVAPGVTGESLRMERRLLLDPAGDEPEDEITYDDVGRCSGGDRARASIAVLSLNRSDLLQARSTAMSEMRRLVDASLRGADEPTGTISSLRSAVHESVPFAGSRRWVLRRALLDTDLGRKLFTEGESLATSAEALGLGSRDRMANAVKVRLAAEAPRNAFLPDSAQSPLAPVRLERVVIRNFRAIQDLSLHFPTASGDREPWLLLLGENGVGKSSVLKAIALACVGDEERRRLEPDARDCVRRGPDRPSRGEVTLTFSDENTLQLRFTRQSTEFVRTGTRPAIVVLGYGPTRLPPRPDESTPEPTRVHVANLFDPRAPLRDVETWLGDVAAVPTRRFNLAATDLKALLPMDDDDRIRRRGGRIYADSRGTRVPLRQLSDGFRSVVALATDVMLHLSAEFESMRTAEALVLLDELEVHLHPSWRMEIVSLLRSVFPRLRVIATTHDPLCLQQTEPGEVVVLWRDDADRVFGEVRDVPKGLRADQLLTGSWFGLSTTTDVDTQTKIEAHGQLLLQPQTAEVQEQRAALEGELRERLGYFADTSLERLALGVAAQLADELPEGQTTHEISAEGRAALRESVLQEVRAAAAPVIRLLRPPEPPTFAPRVKDARTALAKDVAAGNDPKVKELWGDFKPVFSEAQRGRCGYCELSVTAGQPGDVEHFAPKSNVRGFDGTLGEEGRQQAHNANLKDRRPALVSKFGYWWLAYEWSNYLLSCRVCNSSWKGTLYPVKQPPARVVPPTSSSAQGEVPLLLNPFDDEPADHLLFNADGSVEPWNSSDYGRETIRTVGLHRTALVLERAYVIKRAHEVMERAAAAAKRGETAPQNSALRELFDLGRPEAYFPGAVRTVIAQTFGVRWDDLVKVYEP